MNYKKLIARALVIAAVANSAACSHQGETKAGRQAKSVAAGVSKTQQEGEFTATLTYKPLAGILSNLRKDGRQAEGAEAVKLKDKCYFVLSLSANHKELLRQLPFSEYSEIVQILSFRMAEFVDAYPGNRRSVKPIDCFFQPTYGMSSANNVLMVFDKGDFANVSNVRIIVREFGLNVGDLAYDIETKDMN